MFQPSVPGSTTERYRQAFRALLPSLCLAFLAAACGGSGGDGRRDDDSGPDASTQPSPDASTQPSPEAGAATCGNGTREEGEECDQGDLGPATCLSLGYAGGGALTCGDGCLLDRAGCQGADPPEAGTADCGNGTREGDEQCDQGDLGVATCLSLGYASGGALTCGEGCLLSRAGCLGSWTCPADPGEPNESWEAATALVPGTIDRALCAEGSGADQDWYTFDTPAAGRDALLVLSDAPYFSLDAQIHGSLAGSGSAPEVISNVPGSASPGFRGWTWWGGRGLERPDRLYLRVWAPQGAPSVPYRVVYLHDVECFPDGPSPAMACPSGNHCVLENQSFRCVTGCVGDEDCGEGQRCVGGMCKASQCTGHADCAVGLACTWEEQCVDAPCSTLTDCTDGVFSSRGPLVCDSAEGRCVQCLTNQDCRWPDESVCTGSRCALDCAEDVFSPNGTAATAADVTLVDGAFQAPGLTLCGPGATDWLRVTLDQAGPLLVTVEGAQHGQLTLGLYRESDLSNPVPLGQLRNDADRGAALFDLSPGVYLLSIENFPPVTAVATYGLRLSSLPPQCVRGSDCPVGQGCGVFRCEDTSCARDEECAGYAMPCDERAGFCAPCGMDEDCGSLEACQSNRCVPTCTDDAYEQNDARGQAALLTIGEHDLQICKARGDIEEDWFRVNVGAGESIAAYMEPIWDRLRDGRATEWPVLQMFLADGTEVPPDSGPLFRQALTAETVYLRVHAQVSAGAEPWGPIAYRLSLGMNPACVGTPSISDCGEGTYCGGFQCKPGCSSTEQCASGESCVDHACAVPVCIRADECPAGESCVDYACAPGPACDEDWDCRLADVVGLASCDLARGRCVECQADLQCAPGESCAAGACTFPCQDDALEPNDRQENAVAVALGLTSDLSLCVRAPSYTAPYNWPFEEDWYVVDLLAGTTLVAEVNADVQLSIVRADGREVGPVWTVDAGGRAWVRVSPPNPWVSKSTPYTLRLYEVDCAEDQDCNPGSFCRDLTCTPTTCSADESCWSQGTGGRCDTAQGWCVECLADSDCVGTQSCLQGRCLLVCSEDPYEPNNTSDQSAAVALPMDAGGLSLCRPGEEDWFAPDLAPDTDYVLRAETLSGAPGELELQLFQRDASGALNSVGFGTGSPGGVELRHRTGPSDGGWRVLVRSNSPFGYAVTYRLTIGP